MKDDLAAAEGLLNALILVTPFWMTVIWWWAA